MATVSTGNSNQIRAQYQAGERWFFLPYINGGSSIMPIYDHDAIRKAYPDAVVINNDTGVFKEDGTKIEVEQSKIDEARTTRC